MKIGFSSLTGAEQQQWQGSRDKLESGEMKDHFWRLSYVNTRTRHWAKSLSILPGPEWGSLQTELRTGSIRLCCLPALASAWCVCVCLGCQPGLLSWASWEISHSPLASRPKKKVPYQTMIIGFSQQFLFILNANVTKNAFQYTQWKLGWCGNGPMA